MILIDYFLVQYMSWKLSVASSSMLHSLGGAACFGFRSHSPPHPDRGRARADIQDHIVRNSFAKCSGNS